MKIYKLPQLADAKPDGAYLLGREELKTDCAYLIYTRLRPGESGKSVCPKDGSEEIIFIIKGSLLVRQAKSAFTASAGEAFLSNGKLILDNPNKEEAVYITAGGCAEAASRTPAPEPCVKPAEVILAPPVQKEEDPDEFKITRDDGPDEGGE